MNKIERIGKSVRRSENKREYSLAELQERHMEAVRDRDRVSMKILGEMIAEAGGVPLDVVADNETPLGKLRRLARQARADRDEGSADILNRKVARCVQLIGSITLSDAAGKARAPRLMAELTDLLGGSAAVEAELAEKEIPTEAIEPADDEPADDDERGVITGTGFDLDPLAAAGESEEPTVDEKEADDEPLNNGEATPGALRMIKDEGLELAEIPGRERDMKVGIPEVQAYKALIAEQ